ncbi:MAG TPA: hypothetical protein VHD83_18230, partial [Puia sp.]|nr:hypothetical protein [Puia sp.]
MAAKSNPKETVLVITVGFLVLYLVFKHRIFLTLSLVIGLAGILSSWLSEKIDLVWNKLSLVLGWISNTVLLTLIFFLVLTPMGLFRRWLGKGGMLHTGKDLESNFTDREHSFRKEDLEK